MSSASSLLLLLELALQVVVVELAAVLLAEEAHRLVPALLALVPDRTRGVGAIRAHGLRGRLLRRLLVHEAAIRPASALSFLEITAQLLGLLATCEAGRASELANAADAKQLPMRSESANKRRTPVEEQSNYGFGHSPKERADWKRRRCHRPCACARSGPSDLTCRRGRRKYAPEQM